MLTSKSSTSRYKLSIFIEKLVIVRKKLHTIQLIVAVASVAEFFKPNFESVWGFFPVARKEGSPTLEAVL